MFEQFDVNFVDGSMRPCVTINKVPALVKLVFFDLLRLQLLSSKQAELYQLSNILINAMLLIKRFQCSITLVLTVA